MLNIKLLTWGSIEVSTEELLIVARHPQMLILYIGSLFVMYKMRYHVDEPDLPTWINIMFYAVAQLAPLPVIIIAFLLSAFFSRGKGTVQIYATLYIFLAILVSAVAAELIAGQFGGSSDISARLLIWAMMQTLYGEVLGAIVATLMLPGMLAQIRRSNVTPAQMAPPAPPPLPDTTEVPTPVRPPPATLTVGGQTFPAEALLHVRAEGNYVDLTFTTGRLYTLATLMSVTDQLSEVDGCMLSRSVWVSARATAGYQRDGVNYVVTTLDGREFRVARSRNDRVLPWLQERFSAGTLNPTATTKTA